MGARVTGVPWIAAAGVAAIVALGAAGCSQGGGPAAVSSGPSGSSGPRQAIQLAAATAGTVNSFTATINVRLDAAPGSPVSSAGTVSMAGTVTEQVRPSLLARIDYIMSSASGQSMPPMSEIVTAKAMYIKLSAPALAQTLHSAKPWTKIPLSALGGPNAVNLGQLVSQLDNTNPLNQAQLLAGAADVRTVGTATLDGVPVTEYSGSYSVAAALARLPASLRATLHQAFTAAGGGLGSGTASFRVWIDARHQVRKEIVTESTSALRETLTTAVTSINQPVRVTLPPASQTVTVPGISGAPGGGGGIGA